jgi:hypothetical protein
MTQRERRLAIILFGIVALGGFFLAYQLILRPLQEYSSAIASLETDIDDAMVQAKKLRDQKPQLERWRLMSLPIDSAHPTDPSLASREYARYLGDLVRGNFTDINITPMDVRAIATLPGKKAVYTPVTYNIRARAKMAGLVKVLEKFQRTPLMHKIRSLTIERAETTAVARGRRDDSVTVQMSVEALIVTGAERRPTNLLGVDGRLLALSGLSALRGAPPAIALVPAVLSPTGPLASRWVARELPSRNHADLARKNIFLGPLTYADLREMQPAEPAGGPIDVTKYTYLTDITLGEPRKEAWLYIRSSKKQVRLRNSLGFNTFRIKDEKEEETLLSGRVVQIEARDVYFTVGNNYYVIHVGQNFAEAMRQRLRDSEVKSLGLVASTK